MDATFFESIPALRAWLADNHGQAKELLVGFYKGKAGKTGVTYAEALDEALCYGWIDGVRKSVDELRYSIRFTPRKPGSIWSDVNIKRAEELSRLGRLQPAGSRAFGERDETKSKQYSYENRSRPLDAGYEEKLRANAQAWSFFRAQAPSYQRTTSWWVVSAKKEETRLKRLAMLIADSEQGRRLASVTYTRKV